MNYEKLHDRIDKMIEYENDQYLVNINLKSDISDRLYDYQMFHVFNLMSGIRNNDVVLDGSDTGTGKTYTAIAICKQLGLKPFIICPKIVIQNWRNVCKLFHVNPLTIVNYEMIKTGKTYVRTNVDFEGQIDHTDEFDTVVTCKYLQLVYGEKGEVDYIWKLPYNSIIIFDEVHRCKNIKSQNGKLLMSTKNTSVKNRYNHKVLMLSATISDTPKSFHIFGYMLNFYKTLRQARNWINGMLREDSSYIGMEPRMSAINTQIYPFRGSRMRIAELGDKFPVNQISADCYIIDHKDREEVNKALEKISLLNNKIKSKDGEQVLVEITRARQKLEKIKLPILEELILEFLENELSVAVFVNYTETVEKLAEIFKTDCLIYGKISDAVKQQNIEDFQENRKHLIICNIKSGGLSVSLHDLYGPANGGRRRVSIISPSFSSDEMIQTLGRIHRAGAKSPTLQKIIFCAGTCEEVICNKVKEKINFLAKLNDNDLIDIGL